MTVQNKTALITGGGSGIGAATARRFVADGARVVISDINRQGLKEVASSLPAESVRISAGDITKIDDVKTMVDDALEFGGKLDILVNCAGIDPPDHDPDIEKALETFRRIVEVNLTGIFLVMKTAIPYIVAAGGGAVVNISSLSGLRYIAGRPGYTASKGGLISLTQMAAVEYGEANVRCNVICPGPIRTPLFTNNNRKTAEKLGKDVEWIFEKFSAFSPMKRIGEPEEIAGICAFLASDDASFLTGNVLIADGGASIVDVAGPAMRTAFSRPGTGQ